MHVGAPTASPDKVVCQVCGGLVSRQKAQTAQVRSHFPEGASA
jgi:hypothetical protein